MVYRHNGVVLARLAEVVDEGAAGGFGGWGSGVVVDGAVKERNGVG